jgi:hypothetical protein
MKILGLKDGKRFTIWGGKVKDGATVLQIYRSVLFPGRDSSRNSTKGNSVHFQRTNADGNVVLLYKVLGEISLK